MAKRYFGSFGRRRFRRRSYWGLAGLKKTVMDYGLPVGLGAGLPLAINYVGRKFAPPTSIFYEYSHFFGGLGAVIVGAPLLFTGKTEKGIAALVSGGITTAALWYYNTQYTPAAALPANESTGYISTARQMGGVSKGPLPPRTGVGDIDLSVFSSSQSIV